MPGNEEIFDRIIRTVKSHPVVASAKKTLADGVKAVSDEITNMVKSSGMIESNGADTVSNDASDAAVKSTSENIPQTSSEIRRRKVSEWGLPTADDLPAIEEYDDGSMLLVCRPLPFTDKAVAWWPLTIPTEYEPPPERVPDGWRPMRELPDGHNERVWVAYEDGSVAKLHRSLRYDDATGRRLWWRPIEPPAHPGVGR